MNEVVKKVFAENERCENNGKRAAKEVQGREKERVQRSMRGPDFPP